jgi:menaquinone-9 beta-reductase
VSAPRKVEIIGGGLAGLALGLALQRSGVATQIYEAGNYPRHRVCGEFIAGLKERTLTTLGLERILGDVRRHRNVLWYRHERVIQSQSLAAPALAISRYTLDARMAEAYKAVGGELILGARQDTASAPEGRVFATGRRRARSDWVGLKAHVRGIPLASDLEFHLGEGAYVGLCRVEDDTVNVCGLFRMRQVTEISRATALIQYLRLAELGELADRIGSGNFDETSCCAVAGLTFERPPADPSRIFLGDAWAMIPPYTGNGMAIAFQSAECAVEPLAAWARGSIDWAESVRVTTKALQERFNRRFNIAGRLHPFLFSRGPQALFGFANRAGLVPLRSLANAVHT